MDENVKLLKLAAMRHKDCRSLELETVRSIGSIIGYGNMMMLAAACWEDSLKEKNYPEGGSFAIGPCKSQTVPCECEVPSSCPWCCGSGWLTRRVKSSKEYGNK